MEKRLCALDPLLYKSVEDALYNEFIENFYDLIVNAIQPPYAVSIDGLWGTGKTTIMKVLENKLKEEGYPVFWFNPWQYRQTQNVVLAFLQCLAADNEKLLAEMKESGVKILRVLLESGINAGLKLITKGIFSLKDIKESFKSVEKYQNTVKTIEKEFRELIGCISKTHDNKPVIIFFDDLDRCLPEDAIQVLEALKNLFVTRDCKSIFICGIDTHIAKQFIREHYHGIEETFSINYFRKIFNLTISIPYSSSIGELLKKHISKIYEWDDADGSKAEALAEMIDARGLQTQIHSVRHYLNIIMNFYTFLKFNPEYKEQFNPANDFIVNLLMIKEAWYPLYEKLVQEALKTSGNMEQLIKSFAEAERVLPEQYEFLSNFFLENDVSFKQEFLFKWLERYPALA